MATQIGRGHIYGLAGVSCITGVSGSVSPNLKTLRFSHTAEVDRIRGQDGNTGSLIAFDEVLELEISFIPEGSTIASAKVSAGLPSLLSGVTLSGLPVIAMGSYADALNTASGTPWIYEGGGSIDAESETKWAATLPLRRYVGITSAVGITG